MTRISLPKLWKSTTHTLGPRRGVVVKVLPNTAWLELHVKAGDGILRYVRGRACVRSKKPQWTERVVYTGDKLVVTSLQSDLRVKAYEEGLRMDVGMWRRRPEGEDGP